MAREPRSKPKLDTDPHAGGLTHNPFAALGNGTGSPEDAGSASPSSASPSSEGTPPSGKTSSDTDAVHTPAAVSSSRPVASRERKGHGGRTVVRVTGLGEAAADMVKTIGRDLGTGARQDGEDLVVQGDQLERVLAWLEARGLRPIRGTR